MTGARFFGAGSRSARNHGSPAPEQGSGERLAGEVEDLIRAHEDGGWEEANPVQAADSLSFLNCNVDLFLKFARSGKRGGSGSEA